MNLVAFDPSLTSTGVWIDKERKSQVIKTSDKDSRIERLAEIHHMVSLILYRVRPEIVAVEAYAFGINNSRSLTVQAEVGGIIRAIACVLGAGVVEISPTQWKSDILGKEMVRAKKKTKMEQAIYLGVAKAATGYSFETTDEADAAMIAMYVKKAANSSVAGTDAGKRVMSEVESIMEYGREKQTASEPF